MKIASDVIRKCGRRFNERDSRRKKRDRSEEEGK